MGFNFLKSLYLPPSLSLQQLRISLGDNDRQRRRGPLFYEAEGKMTLPACSGICAGYKVFFCARQNVVGEEQK